jgi:LysR family transcriptional regulator, transcriptional activator for bauABCD operon
MRRLDNIDLRLLRVFLTLTETGSFAAAQIALNLSQPTLSGHIAALERSLGGPLCLRGRRGFKLTPFGEATARAARQLFAEIDGFQQRVAEYNGQLVGRLRIGVVDGVVTCPDLGLHAVLDRVIGRAHSLFIDLELGTPHELERGINEGRYDVAVGPLSQKAPGITYVSLHREAQALYCGRGHPLFAVPDSAIDQAAIERSAFSVRGYRQLEDLYRVNHPRASATVLHMEAQALLILSGRFIGFLPRHIGESWVSQGQMRVIKPQTYGFQSHHLVAYRRAAADQPLVQAFLQELRRRPSAP